MLSLNNLGLEKAGKVAPGRAREGDGILGRLG